MRRHRANSCDVGLADLYDCLYIVSIFKSICYGREELVCVNISAAKCPKRAIHKPFSFIDMIPVEFALSTLNIDASADVNALSGPCGLLKIDFSRRQDKFGNIYARTIFAPTDLIAEPLDR